MAVKAKSNSVSSVGLEVWAERLERLLEDLFKMHAASTFKVAIDILRDTANEIFSGSKPYVYVVDRESGALLPFSGTDREDAPDFPARKRIADRAAAAGEQITVKASHPEPWLDDIIKQDYHLKPLAIACPLKNKQDQVAGVLILEYEDEMRFGSVEQRLLGKLTDHIPEIISDHQRLSDAPESAERFNLILDVGTKIAAKIELQPLLAEIGLATSELLEAERSSVYVVDDDEEVIYTLFGQGYEIGIIKLPKGKGIAGRVYETEQVINVEDAYELDYFDRSWDEKSGYRTKSVLCAPMFDRQGKIIGVFQVLNKQTAKRFTANDERILRTLGSFAAVAIENAKLYEEQKKQFSSFIEVLAASVDAKDPTTSDHSMYVTGASVVIAKELGLDPAFVEKIRIAATLHDYGKIAVPDAVLCKPAKLLPCEVYLMNFHVEKTETILKDIRWAKELQDVPFIAATHHEAIDGSGYPHRLKGEEIPYGGRIIAVADVFHALIQNRPYKLGLPPRKAIEICEQMTIPHVDERYGTRKGKHLQADIVAALRSWLEKNDWNVKLFEKESGWTKGVRRG
ncbi:MAG: GAF domain-containing protein [bacterium]|jgi:HD-GYP domain-containing protein (c-di-GMP phosphodiesterase class II)